MKRILVTTDLSANSKAGIKFAIQISIQTGAEIIFYHALEMMKPASWSQTRFSKFRAEKEREITASIQKLIFPLLKSAGSPLLNDNKIVIEIGNNIPELVLRSGKKHRVDLVCLSTKGAGNVQRLFGTTASEMIMKCPLPLAIVPKKYKVKKLDRLFYSTDLGALTSELRIVNQLAKELSARVSVYYYDYLLLKGSNTQAIDKKIKPHIADNITFHLQKQEVDKSLADHLRSDIKKEKPEGVILFTKQNRNWFDKLFSRSNATDVAFNSDVPLFVFRKKAR